MGSATPPPRGSVSRYRENKAKVFSDKLVLCDTMDAVGYPTHKANWPVPPQRGAEGDPSVLFFDSYARVSYASRRLWGFIVSLF